MFATSLVSTFKTFKYREMNSIVRKARKPHDVISNSLGAVSEKLPGAAWASKAGKRGMRPPSQEFWGDFPGTFPFLNYFFI